MASVAVPGPGFDTIGEQKCEETGMLRRLDWALLLDYDAKERQAPPCLASCSLRQQAAMPMKRFAHRWRPQRGGREAAAPSGWGAGARLLRCRRDWYRPAP